MQCAASQVKGRNPMEGQGRKKGLLPNKAERPIALDFKLRMRDPPLAVIKAVDITKICRILFLNVLNSAQYIIYILANVLS